MIAKINKFIDQKTKKPTDKDEKPEQEFIYRYTGLPSQIKKKKY